METAFALFIWPGLVLGGLIAYGYFTSRKPKSSAERASEEATALSEARKARQEIEELSARIEAFQAALEADSVAARAEYRVRRSQAGQFVLRPRTQKGRALVARYVHSS